MCIIDTKEIPVQFFSLFNTISQA